MGKELTLEIAKQFLQDNDAVNLEEFTSIADDAAVALRKHEGWLLLNSLTTLSDAAAAALSKHEGRLSLDSLTALSDAAAVALSQHKGGLSLNGLTTLSDVAAAALSQPSGDLLLDGLTALSDAAAAALSQHEGELDLKSLTTLSDAAAAALSKNEGLLYLPGLTTLSDAAAVALSQHKGGLSLNGLTTLSDAAAAALSKHEGRLSLDSLTTLSDAAAAALSKHEGRLYLGSLTTLSDAAATAVIAVEGEDQEQSADEAEDNDFNECDSSVEKEDSVEEAGVKPDLKRFRSIDLITRKLAALIVVHDGQATVTKQEWLETHWGPGAYMQVIHLATEVTGENLADEIRSLLSDDASSLSDLRQSLENLRELVPLGSGDEEQLNQTLEVLNEFEADDDDDDDEEDKDEESSKTPPESLRLRAALANGDVTEAKALIAELDLDQISQAFCDHGVEGSLGFLSHVMEERLHKINSAQFVLKGKPRVVTLAEVNEKCGPIYEAGKTASFGPRPAGWGAAAAEGRILSWTDQGFGLTGDQVVNVDTRYICAKSLAEFEGAIIAGPLDSVTIEECPAEMSVVTWRGKPLSMDPVESKIFRDVFLQRMIAWKELSWTYDFGANANTGEAFRFFMQDGEANFHAELKLTQAVVHGGFDDESGRTEKSRELLTSAMAQDPAVKTWAEWIDAWLDFPAPEALNRMAALKDGDPVGSALLTACLAYADLKAGKAIDLQVVEAVQAHFRNAASPYLSWMLETTCDRIIAHYMQSQPDLEKGGDPALYEKAIRLGFRHPAIIVWLLKGIHTGAGSLVKTCLDSGFKPVGRFRNGGYLNLLATAAVKGRAEMVELFMLAGADPEEPSHYDGLSTLKMAELDEANGTPWPAEVLTALKGRMAEACRNENQFPSHGGLATCSPTPLPMTKNDSPGRYLTKSRFKLGMECPAKLFYTGKENTYANSKLQDAFLAALAEGGFQVGELAKQYFPGGKEIEPLNYEEALQQTNALLSQENVVIFEAAVCFQNLFIRADILVKKGNSIDLIEVKAKSFDPEAGGGFMGIRGGIAANWKPYLWDVAFQKHVITKAFPKFTVRAFLMLADKTALCPTDGLHQKFRIVTEKTVEGKMPRKKAELTAELHSVEIEDRILCQVNVDHECDVIYTQDLEVEQGPAIFGERIDWLAAHYERDEKIECHPAPVCAHCEFKATAEEEADGLLCGFKECWKKALKWRDKDFATPNVQNIWNYHGKGKLMAENLIAMADVTEEDIQPKSDGKPGKSPSERQWLQVEKTQAGDSTPWVDKAGLWQEMNQWKFPLHFIDFETTRVAIPFNKGRHPYELVAFQFSHHVVREDGRVEHKGQYLNTERGVFPNYDFVRALMKELSEDAGSIFRYATHENSTLAEIDRQLSEDAAPPEDRDTLKYFIRSITTAPKMSTEQWEGDRNVIDLFQMVKRYHYDPATNGSNSIKAVLPAILNASTFLKAKYAQPIYGANDGIPSLNFKNQIWIKQEDGKVVDPYKLLPKMFTDVSGHGWARLSADDELRDGGAAMTAYARMQFEEMSDPERDEIRSALLRYCELDTLAMVMIYEEWRELVSELSARQHDA